MERVYRELLNVAIVTVGGCNKSPIWSRGRRPRRPENV